MAFHHFENQRKSSKLYNGQQKFAEHFEEFQKLQFSQIRMKELLNWFVGGGDLKLLPRVCVEWLLCVSNCDASVEAKWGLFRITRTSESSGRKSYSCQIKPLSRRRDKVLLFLLLLCQN